MARGWESKSVEEQQMANAVQNPEVNPGTGIVNEEARRLAEQKRAASLRQMQALELQRENILSQRTSNPSRREALAAALSDVEARIKALS
jgi:hypothetical protein